MLDMVHIPTEKRNNKQAHWEGTTSDELINAWEAGKQHFKEKTMKKIQENLNTACELSESIFSKMVQENKIKCKQVHLKIENVNSFSAVFVIPESDFISIDKFVIVNQVINDEIANCANKNLNYSFLVMPFSRNINKHALVADGYRYSYPQNGKK